MDAERTRDRLITTYTMWSLFRNCRRACYWRYTKNLVPLAAKERALHLGSVVHQALEMWYRNGDLGAVLGHIDTCYATRTQDHDLLQDWHYTTAMIRAYVARYPDEPWEVVALEKVFQGEIENPATNATSRSFLLAGRVDGIVRKQDGSLYLLEHKTASIIGSDYVGKLWTDFQIVLYSHYLRQLGIPLEGVVYNILVKPKLQQGRGETEAEFQARAADLASRNKSGKSSAQRKIPESDIDFATRLAAWFEEPERFVRVELIFDTDTYDNLRSELWELTQQFLYARRREAFYQNTSFCFAFHRPCPYWAICSSKNNSLVIQTQYQERPPHTELNPTGDTVNPVF